MHRYVNVEIKYCNTRQGQITIREIHIKWHNSSESTIYSDWKSDSISDSFKIRCIKYENNRLKDNTSHETWSKRGQNTRNSNDIWTVEFFQQTDLDTSNICSGPSEGTHHPRSLQKKLTYYLRLPTPKHFPLRPLQPCLTTITLTDKDC